VFARSWKASFGGTEFGRRKIVATANITCSAGLVECAALGEGLFVDFIFLEDANP